MNVLFIKPGRGAHSNFPHQYAALGSYVKQLGHRTSFYDASLNSETPEEVINKIDFRDADVICISIYTGWQKWASDFTKLIKKYNTNIRIIVGGPHISALKEYAVEHIGADYGIAGEGEIPLGRILECLNDVNKAKNIPGVIYKEGSAYKFNLAFLERVKNLDDLPIPDYNLIRPEEYFHTYLGASVARKKYRSVQTITSRGCPFQCTFCATNCTWENKFTFLSPERVVEEAEYLINGYGIKEIWFGDDGFTMNKQRVMQLCELILKKDIKFLWRLPNGVRLESLDEEIVSIMKRAGCYMMGIGIESGSPEILKKIKKRLDLDLVNEKVLILKKYNILTSGFFIFGFPEETEENLKETKKFIIKSPLKRMQISVFAPYPGSEDFDNIFGKNDFHNYISNIRRYLYEDYVPDFLKYLDVDTIQKYYRDTYISFYLKPSVITSLIKNITKRQIKDILMHPSFKSIFKLKRTAEKTYVGLDN